MVSGVVSGISQGERDEAVAATFDLQDLQSVNHFLKCFCSYFNY